MLEKVWMAMEMILKVQEMRFLSSLISRWCGIPLMDTSGSMCCDYVFEFQSL